MTTIIDLEIKVRLYSMTMLNQLKSGDLARIISFDNESVFKKNLFQINY